ncbi:hypothetical protein TNCT_84911 [Trichonephila clavata]|uniref:Uncharacterized protein n=1 Tax=Trichonephila clavata TaxID=2740835 RepID=A0A8X6L347_TRICU|nr:hypothetical protein TNCT_84911 [Trichonephila clavata]
MTDRTGFDWCEEIMSVSGITLVVITAALLRSILSSNQSPYLSTVMVYDDSENTTPSTDNASKIMMKLQVPKLVEETKNLELDRQFDPWGGKKRSHQYKRQFSPWGGKRSSVPKTYHFEKDVAVKKSRKKPSFHPWSTKAFINVWSNSVWNTRRPSISGERKLSLAKRNAHLWDSKPDSLDLWIGKKSFSSWGGKKSLNSLNGKKSFNSWGGKRGFNSWGGKRSFNSWGGKRSFNSWGGKRGFNSWGGKRGFNSWGGKRGFNSWGGKRGFNSWGGKKGFNSRGIKRNNPTEEDSKQQYDVDYTNFILSTPSNFKLH